MQQAIDFRDESDSLYKLLSPLKDHEFDQPTQFKGWTINDVLGHLHFWNWTANLTLKDGEAFQAFYSKLMKEVRGGSLREAEKGWRKGIMGNELLETWREYYIEMAVRFEKADPKMRLKWAGPDMSVRSSITARLMETWAHGQEVYDTLGVNHISGDGIKNIVVLGVNTFGWTYLNRGLDVPSERPFVKLIAPSGENWEWGDASDSSYIEGKAEEFCQVVTQVRNVADTSLQLAGDVAVEWMSMAQCFAGGPQDPPAPMTRFTQAR
jgi:uncharacterized protein (TIGR03084 family)